MIREDSGENSLVAGVYRILRRLGRGGEGEVYLVQHVPTDQLRAAKVICYGEAERRMHELHMLKHLCHSSLPRIIDVFEWESRIWLIMEYIQGCALSELSGRDVDGEQFFRIALELAGVLIYLHAGENPILHLDIKPSNILVRKNGHPVLIDFGASVRSRDVRENTGLGTRGFAAPEQMEDARKTVDVRADIYGFGATMYYFLYGRKPCKASCGPDDAKRGKAHRSALWKRQAGAILEKCLCEDRERRYPDFCILYRELDRAQKRYLRRKRLSGISAAGALLLLALAFAVRTLLPGEKLSEEQGIAMQERYRQLLDMSAQLGLTQAFSLYEEAAQICPAGDWGLIMLERLTEDYLFTAEEEGMLRTLIYGELPGLGLTAAEAMEQEPEIYGEFCYRLGLAYWYFYQDAGGRRAAASWFARALSAREGEETPAVWLESARIHAGISSYYEKLGRQDEEGRVQADFLSYWEDLMRLVRMESLQEESPGIQRQVIAELLSCLIMGAARLRQDGETRESMEEVLHALAAAVEDMQLWPEREQREAVRKQYQDAEAAVERAFADERGPDAETEQISAE